MRIMQTLLIAASLFIAFGGKAQQALLAKNDKVLPVVHQYSVQNDEKQVFSITPSSVKKTVRVNIEAARDEWAIIEIKDAGGEVVLEQQMAVSSGTNSIPVFFISKLEKGAYTAVLTMEGKIYTSPLIKE